MRINLRIGKKSVFLTAAMLAIGTLTLYTSNASAVLPYQWSRISSPIAGGNANGSAYTNTGFLPLSLSNNGRYVAFQTQAYLDSADISTMTDVYVRDMVSNTFELATLGPNGEKLLQTPQTWKLSGNGRYLMFIATCNTFVASCGADKSVYIRDLQLNTTTTVAGTTYTNKADISSNGRYLAYTSLGKLYVKDLKLNATTQLDKSTTGGNADASSSSVSMSCDGSVVAFNSAATNLVANDTNGQTDTFVVERNGGNKITNITLNGNGSSLTSSLTNGILGTLTSCDSGTVAFISAASNLVSNDTNAVQDGFVYNIYSGTTTRVTESGSGQEANADIDTEAGWSISADGNYVTFMSKASNLVSGVNTTTKRHAYFKNVSTGEIDWVNAQSLSTPPGSTAAHAAAISADGKYVSVVTGYADMMPVTETDSYIDVYLSPTNIPLTAL